MKRVVLILLLLCLVGCSGETITGGAVVDLSESVEYDYEGTWVRQATYTDGEVVSTESASLLLTADSFSSSSAYCRNSGSLDVVDATILMVVESTNCPGVIAVGSSVSSVYDVDGIRLTLINTQYGAEVKEIYLKA